MGRNEALDPFDFEDAYDDVYFDGEELDYDLLYELHSLEDYDILVLDEDDE